MQGLRRGWGLRRGCTLYRRGGFGAESGSRQREGKPLGRRLYISDVHGWTGVLCRLWAEAKYGHGAWHGHLHGGHLEHIENT